MLRSLKLVLSENNGQMVKAIDLSRAVIELGLARINLKSSVRKLAVSGAFSRHHNMLLTREAKASAIKIAYVIPRVAARLPWRSDCLVQMLAARHWLATKGIMSTVHLGTKCKDTEEFEAHAWLTVGDEVITGGDVKAYIPFV